MRDSEMGLDEFGGKHMYRAIINFLRSHYPEILDIWQTKVRNAIEWQSHKILEA